MLNYVKYAICFILGIVITLVFTLSEVVTKNDVITINTPDSSSKFMSADQDKINKTTLNHDLADNVASEVIADKGDDTFASLVNTSQFEPNNPEDAIKIEDLLDNYFTVKQQMIDELSHRLLATDEYNISTIDATLTMLSQFDGVQIDNKVASHLLNVVSSSSSDNADMRYRVLINLRGSVDERNISQLQSLLYDDAYSDTKTAWEALALINEMEDRKAVNDTLADINPSSLPQEMANALHDILDVGEHYNVRQQASLQALFQTQAIAPLNSATQPLTQ